jgi:hypothetical protein
LRAEEESEGTRFAVSRSGEKRHYRQTGRLGKNAIELV